jgi:putative Holliday junction resolvase
MHMAYSAGMKYIGIDYGTKRIGIALSDDGGSIAFPKTILANDGKGGVIREIALLCARENVGGIVIGQSLGRDFSENALMKYARTFGEHAHALTGLPVVYEWEGYSTAAAKNARRPEGAARGDVARKTKQLTEHVDAHAAAIILQSFLDKHDKSR